MKSQLHLSKISFFIILFAIISSLQMNGEDKKYIFFNNLDPTFAQTAYLENFQKYNGLVDYAPHLLSVPFSDATFAQHKITDFDLAIFTMGDKPLSYKSGNSSVIKKIKEMIAAGKNVLITGRQILYKALAPAGSDKDPETINFLTNTMGINYIKRKKVYKVEGNTTTWWSFVIHGHFGDPIGKSIRKGCNMRYNGWDPLANLMSLDVFFTKDKNKYYQVEHFIYHDGLERNDTIVATRTEIGKSRIVLYALGFEAFAGEIPRGSLLYRCMFWTLGNIKPDGAVLQLDPVNMDFERVKIGSTRILPLVINNIGKEELVITGTSFFDNPDDAFKITEGEIKSGDTPVKLKSGESHKMKVSFTPKKKNNYAVILSIHSNSATGNIKDINCVGTGGQETTGPKVSTNYGKMIDFGKLRKGRSKKVNLTFYNKGENELTVQTCKMDASMRDHDFFTFAQVMRTPFFVKPGDSTIIKVKFAAVSEKARIYKGKIIIECDALNDPNFEIRMMGEIKNQSDVEEWKNDFGTIKILPNPITGNKFNIRLNINHSINTPINISITDIIGNKVSDIYSGRVPLGETVFTADASGLATGLYFIVTQLNSRKIITRMLISR